MEDTAQRFAHSDFLRQLGSSERIAIRPCHGPTHSVVYQRALVAGCLF